MFGDETMNNLESYSLNTIKQCDAIKQKIAQHTPAKNRTDERMIRIYKRLLIRDRHYLHNLELLKIQAAMQLEAKPLSGNRQDSTSDSITGLNLDEFRSLLDENSELAWS
jgi:hypothetical protein